jgi:hypothetical protein
MAARGKLGRLCGALFVAVSMIALSAGAARAQDANDLADLNARILDNPQDVELNLQYARAAEEAGLPRLALVAYERILINDASNSEARRGYERIRRQIEPGYTVTRVEVGARYDTNALNTNEDTFVFVSDEREATTYFGRAMVANEHEFFGRRWRSTLNAEIEETPDIDELDYSYLGVQTGPIFYVAPHLAAIPSVGGAISWLGGEQYYSEANIGVTIEGRVTGASYWARARAGYRDYNPDTTTFFTTVTEEGPYAEVQGGLTKPHLFSERDTLLVQPFVRWSDVEGSVFSFWLFDEVSPGKYLEYGVDANYNYQITDHIQASVGALVRQRDFRESSREDFYVAPQTSVAIQGLLPCECDVKVQYRYRDNDTNDIQSDYNANQVSVSLMARF